MPFTSSLHQPFAIRAWHMPKKPLNDVFFKGIFEVTFSYIFCVVCNKLNIFFSPFGIHGTAVIFQSKNLSPYPFKRSSILTITSLPSFLLSQLSIDLPSPLHLSRYGFRNSHFPGTPHRKIARSARKIRKYPFPHIFSRENWLSYT